MSSVISIRIPKELKIEMEKYDVNWPEYIREAIEEKIKQVKREKALELISKLSLEDE
ncbi:MAG: hypothetical protein RQ968_03940 [Thermoproteota archaeon]|nr:hypothetical protein [Thermoproteota archaeon]